MRSDKRPSWSAIGSPALLHAFREELETRKPLVASTSTALHRNRYYTRFKKIVFQSRKILMGEANVCLPWGSIALRYSDNLGRRRKRIPWISRPCATPWRGVGEAEPPFGAELPESGITRMRLFALNPVSPIGHRKVAPKSTLAKGELLKGKMLCPPKKSPVSRSRANSRPASRVRAKFALGRPSPRPPPK